MAIGNSEPSFSTISSRRWYRNSPEADVAVEQAGGFHDVSTAIKLLPDAAAATADGTFVDARPDKRSLFQVTAPYEPTGDQPEAIEQLVRQVQRGDKYSVLRGITGTGKTLVMAHLIAKLQRKTLVLCHNKTLAAQLARELRSFFKKNRVELFVSYYNHYVPEAFKEATGKYIAKKSSVNEELDALRHLATNSLLQHDDVVVVASVSCIYGLGMPEEYLKASARWDVGDIFEDLVEIEDTLQTMLYINAGNVDEEVLDDDSFDTGKRKRRNKARGQSRTSSNKEEMVRGRYELDTNPQNGVSTLSLWPPSEAYPLRILLQPVSRSLTSPVSQEDADDRVQIISIGRGQMTGLVEVDHVIVFPTKHHVTTSQEGLDETCRRIEDELKDREKVLRDEGRKEEADRLQHRVIQDLAMIRDLGFCAGIENYSRHLALREAGEAPACLLDYFSKKWATDKNGHNDADAQASTEITNATNNGEKNKGDDWLLLVDESHVTLPQLKAMYRGDQARKKMLVKHGYRLPSCLDNRPLQEREFFQRIRQGVFVSATPSKQELQMSTADPVDMLIRPTYVCDPSIEVRPSGPDQLEDLLREVKLRRGRGERTLVMALTKQDAEDYSKYLGQHDVLSTYIHSGLNTQERSDALKALQLGRVDCLVGVNLLREGLDLPQVSLVAILNADSQGFLRSETAMLQTVGRAARNVNGAAIMYANKVTSAMQECINITKYRRELQLRYNEEHGTKMRSTTGSTMQSIFDVLKDQIEAQKSVATARNAPNGAIGGGSTSSSASSRGSNGVVAATGTMQIAVGADDPANIETDHIPAKPGVYFWKGGDGSTLYIGKAKKLRNRVKSYLASGAKHSRRIQVMIQKATNVEFIVTPSDRDALLLESNLIKHHQPPYNVLLRDDASYPYICASLEDEYPRFHIVPTKANGDASSVNKYFGPYPHHSEVSQILQRIEDKYNLRTLALQARHGSLSKTKYRMQFETALQEVFEIDANGDLAPSSGCDVSARSLAVAQLEYQEASQLFDSKYNENRDVVAIQPFNDQTEAVVQVMQLRDGLIAGKFAYRCQLSAGMDAEEDYSAVLQTVLERQHYPSGGDMPAGSFSFLPNEILLQYPLPDVSELRLIIRTARRSMKARRSSNSNDGEIVGADGQVNGSPAPKKRTSLAIRTPVTRGPRKSTDQRAMKLAIENAQEEARQNELGSVRGATKTSLDGTAVTELQSMLNIERPIKRIECYDISHTQGSASVGSCVAFVDGRPSPKLYRQFHIKTVKGIDDYASLEEVIGRRLRHAFGNTGSGRSMDRSDDDWAAPDLIVIDGGRGQLNAAVKGMAKVGVAPYLPTSRNVVTNGATTTASAAAAAADHVRDDGVLDCDDNTSLHIVEEEYIPIPVGVDPHGHCGTDSEADLRPTIPVISLAKNQEEVFSLTSSAPINDRPDSPALLLLRSIRDESHRFALKNHRILRSKLNGLR